MNLKLHRVEDKLAMNLYLHTAIVQGSRCSAVPLLWISHVIQAEGKCCDMQSIIVPSCLVCGFVASLAIMLLVHQYEQREREPNNVNVKRTT